MSTPESKVKLAVKRKLDELNAWSFAPVSNGMGVMGIPDRIACVPVQITADMVGRVVGLFVGVECKAPGKEATVTPLQRRQLNSIAAAGGIALVVSTDVDAIHRAIVDLSRRTYGVR